MTGKFAGAEYSTKNDQFRLRQSEFMARAIRDEETCALAAFSQCRKRRGYSSSSKL